MLPSFIIVGAMKSGTSSLFKYLVSNPNIIGSSIKETNFFISDKSIQRGLDWYQSLFKGNGNCAFEASTSYSKRHNYPGVPERMHAFLPEIKLIYLLRDPVKRIISHYMHNYASRKESRAFPDAIREPNCGYIQTSKYYYQIQAYLEYYANEQILIIDSNQLFNDTRSVLTEISDFLNIPDEYDEQVIEKKFNQSKKKHRRSDVERALFKKINHRYVVEGVKRISGLFRNPVETPIPTAADLEIIKQELAPDVRRMRDFSGLNFSDWKF